MRKLIDIINDEKADKETISTGFKQLDRLTQGFRKSDLVYIGARPAMGKTTFAVQLAENLARAGKKCAFFSMELSAEGIAKRFPQINSNLEICIDDTPAPTVSEMKQKVKDLKDVDYVIIDYFALIKPEIKSTNRIWECSKIAGSLQTMAEELNVIVICNITLPVLEKRPQLSDFMCNGALIQDADVIMFLYRDEFTLNNMNNRDPSITELIIAKNRYGDTGTIELKYDSKAKQFTEADDL